MSLFLSRRQKFEKIALIIIIVLFMLQSNEIAAQPKLKICHEDNHNPPFIYQDSEQIKGILIDIVELTSSKSGAVIEIYSKPWVRCQQDVKMGKAHALFAMISTIERQSEYAFPPQQKLNTWHLWFANYPVFVPVSSNFSLETYKPIKGIGAPLGYVVWDKLKENNWLSPFQYTPSQGFNMLAINKLDGYVVEQIIGQNLIHEQNLATKVKVSKHSIVSTYWYLPFNQKFYLNNKELVHEFWRNIALAREKIKAHYVNKHPNFYQSEE